MHGLHYKMQYNVIKKCNTRTIAQNTKSEDLKLALAIVLGGFNSHCNVSE